MNRGPLLEGNAGVEKNPACFRRVSNLYCALFNWKMIYATTERYQNSKSCGQAFQGDSDWQNNASPRGQTPPVGHEKS
jgi:hypothetical protein